MAIPPAGIRNWNVRLCSLQIDKSIPNFRPRLPDKDADTKVSATVVTRDRLRDKLTRINERKKERKHKISQKYSVLLQISQARMQSAQHLWRHDTCTVVEIYRLLSLQT